MTMRRLVATRWALPAARGAWAAGAAAGGAAWASGEHSMARAAPWASIWRRFWRVPSAAGGASAAGCEKLGRGKQAPIGFARPFGGQRITKAGYVSKLRRW